MDRKVKRIDCVQINENNEVIRDYRYDLREGDTVPLNYYEVVNLPKRKKGFALIYDKKTKEVKEVIDQRGKEYWTDTNTKRVVTDLNFELPKGATFEPKPNQFCELKNGKWTENIKLKLNAHIENLKSQAQSVIDSQAREFGFDNINSCAKYGVFDNVFKTSADNLISWTIEVWSTLDGQLKTKTAQQILETTAENITETIKKLGSYPKSDKEK